MTQPLQPPERESELQFLIGVLSILIGGLLLVFAAILYASSGSGLASEGMPRFRLVAAIGAGLVALGVSLEFPRLMDLVRQRKSLHAANAVLMSVLAFIILVIVNFLSARHDFWRADLTQEGLYTLSDESRALVGVLDRDVRLVVLTAADQDRDMSPLHALLDQYRSESARVRVERIDLRRKGQTELLALLKELGLEGQRFEDELLGVVVQAQLGEGLSAQRTKHVPKAELWEQAFDRSKKRTFLGEQKLSSAIREVLEEKRAKLYFLTGHAEASIDEHDDHGGGSNQEGLGTLAAMLRQRNMELAELKLTDGGPVPDDCDLLVIPGPRVALDPREVASVERFLERGGDALILLDPVVASRDGGGTRFAESGLEPLLKERYGVLSDDALIFTQVQDPIVGLLLTEEVQGDEFDVGHQVGKRLAREQARVMLLGARPLRTTPAPGATTSELVKTGSRAPVFAVGDPLGLRARGRPTDEPQRGPFTLVVTSERSVGEGEEQQRSRVVVVGDVGWAQNLAIGVGRFHNLELFLNAASWAMNREERLVGKASRPKSYRLEMAPETLAAMKLFSFFGLPSVAIGLGLFAWMLRRR
ncbi:MAG: GldG family protein [Planctomycetes bacterium]|nr:GldG family protein [Planctomycetota bacterium]